MNVTYDGFLLFYSTGSVFLIMYEALLCLYDMVL